MALQRKPQTVGYYFEGAAPSHTHTYLWPKVLKELECNLASGSSLFELGCGNGALMAELTRLGFTPTGVDPSDSGITAAREKWPSMNVNFGSAYDDLASNYGQFPAVVSLEVIEHLYSPHKFASTLFELLQPNGLAIVSTPYHGYFKYLALAITGKMDQHLNPLWEHGHIKFWSAATLKKLLVEAGFQSIQFSFAGRLFPFSKSLIATARRPPSAPELGAH